MALPEPRWTLATVISKLRNGEVLFIQGGRYSTGFSGVGLPLVYIKTLDAFYYMHPYGLANIGPDTIEKIIDRIGYNNVESFVFKWNDETFPSSNAKQPISRRLI